MQIEQSQKLTFSGHETFPLKYGWLKKVYDIVSNSDEPDARKVFSSDDAIANFGVGKNMVSSMRHWAQLANILIIDHDTKFLRLTNFAEDFFSEEGLDPWLEHNATLWLIHWNIAKKSSLFTYYWVFNYLNRNEFNREQIAISIMNVLRDNQHELPSPLTLKRDIECFVRNYTHKSANKSGIFSEENIESPLSELNLIKRLPHDRFSIQRGYKPHLPLEVFLYALTWFWKEHFPSTNTLSLESATYDPESPGRLFFLDEDAVVSYAFEAEALKRIGISWSETAGLRQFITTKNLHEIFKKAEKQLKSSYGKER